MITARLYFVPNVFLGMMVFDLQSDDERELYTLNVKILLRKFQYLIVVS